MTERVYGGVTASVLGPHHTTKCVIITRLLLLLLLHLLLTLVFKFTSDCIIILYMGRQVEWTTKPVHPPACRNRPTSLKRENE